MANTINTSVAQRLVRKLCLDCCTSAPLNAKDWSESIQFEKPENHTVSVGCDKCHYTGYKGRLALYEVIPIDHAISVAIKQNEHEIDQLLHDRNIKRLSDKAYEVFTEGLTSLDEVYPLLTGF